MNHCNNYFAGLPAMLLGFLFLFLLPVGVAGADYYWVGGGGNWSDVSRWRTATGGSDQHANLPGSGDHVIFDANSGFTSASNVLLINVDAECGDMTWIGAPNNPVLRGTANRSIRLSGSLALQNNMVLELNQESFEWRFTGIGDHTITTNGNILAPGDYVGTSVIGGVYFDGTGGQWTMMDDFSAGISNIYLLQGVLNTNDHRLETHVLSSLSDLTRGLILGSSEVVIGQKLEIEKGSFTLNAGTSTIRFAGFPAFGYIFSVDFPDLTFYNLEFIEPNSNYALINGNNTSFNQVVFHGDGVIRGVNKFERLILMPGSEREFLFIGGETEITVNEIVASGNPCFPMHIKSFPEGTSSMLIQESGEVTLHFVELKGIHAMGGATFTAINSVDAGNNNTVWVFEEDITNSFLTLGNDTTINCSDMPYTLTTSSFFPNHGTTFQWDDPLSSTGSELVANDFGEYSVTVTYDPSCPTITRQIELQSPGFPDVDLGRDTIICDGCELELDAGSGPLYTYLWEPNGEETQKIMVNASGTYRVVVTNEFGCEADDEIVVTVMTPVPYRIPNAFYPDSPDYPENRVFGPVFNPGEELEYSMNIFNRWGQLIFQSGVAGQTWDGTHEGSEAPQGTYRYVIEVKQPWDYTEKRIGIVTLLR